MCWKGHTVWASPTIARGIVYVADGEYAGVGVGVIRALDVTTGAERWSATLPAPVLSSPTVADGMLFVGCDDGYLYALRESRRSLARAVFWDSLAAPWGLIGGQTAIRDYMRTRGYEILDATALVRWMERQISDGGPSVVAFAIDHAPRSVAATSADTVLLRRYLNAGGKIIWPGLPPRYWLPDSAGQRPLSTFGAGGGTLAVLGVSLIVDPFDRYTASPTALGAAWGLSGWWLSAMATESTSGLDVLATDERGFAAAWLKRFSRVPGSGFVSLPHATWDAAALRRVAYAAEYWPRL